MPRRAGSVYSAPLGGRDTAGFAALGCLSPVAASAPGHFRNMRLDIAAQSDIGRRKDTNEDFFGVFRDDADGLTLFDQGAFLCVADGLGGHIGGEIASKLAVSIMRDVIKETPPSGDPESIDERFGDLLRDYTIRSNAGVYRTNEDLVSQGKPMGTTLISALVTPRKVYICNVGDSRCYHIREGLIIGKTEDHSWVDEQVKLGLMSKAEAELDTRKNVVTRSIGTRAEVEVDMYLWHTVPGDWILLCTDGLINMVKEEEILEEFKKGATAAEIAARLVAQANENGGKDNITVLAANISPNPVRLIYLKTQALVRRQGPLVCLLGGVALFILGYFTRDQDWLRPILNLMK